VDIVQSIKIASFFIIRPFYPLVEMYRLSIRKTPMSAPVTIAHKSAGSTDFDEAAGCLKCFGALQRQ
jgi:hypothetical protein